MRETGSGSQLKELGESEGRNPEIIERMSCIMFVFACSSDSVFVMCLLFDQTYE
jgi:hypothetical protein